MNKRKLLTLAMTLCMVAILAIGGTLAYFVDVEQKTNVFTVGNLDITLNDVFVPDSELVPGTKTQNAVNKDVSVTNNSTKNEAWVRVKISVPSNLDVLTTPPANYEEVAANNILHWNTKAGVEEIWNVKKANDEAVLSEDGKWNVYTFYYNKKLSPGATTELLLDQVYLDSRVDMNEEGQYVFNGEVIDLSNVKIDVVAEAIQGDGFDTYEAAFAAFDAQVNYDE